MASRYYRRRRSGNGIMPLILIGIVAQSYGFTADIASTLLIYAVIVAAAVTLMILLIRVWRWRQRTTVLNSMLAVDAMTGLEFERYVAALLKRQGFARIKLTERCDWGVDIIAHKDGIRWGIQTKRNSGLVKVAAVRQVVAALNKYGCERGMVITNGTFSRPATEIARSNNCVLMDRNQLARWMSDMV